jgi:hypothetical protein
LRQRSIVPADRIDTVLRRGLQECRDRSLPYVTVPGRLSRQEALRWLAEYGRVSSEEAERVLRFIERYRSYVIKLLVWRRPGPRLRRRGGWAGFRKTLGCVPGPAVESDRAGASRRRPAGSLNGAD